MSKYNALWAYIYKSGKPQPALTFDEIGQIADMYFDNEASIVLGIMLILGSLLCRYGTELRKHPGEVAQ